MFIRVNHAVWEMGRPIKNRTETAGVTCRVARATGGGGRSMLWVWVSTHIVSRRVRVVCFSDESLEIH